MIKNKKTFLKRKNDKNPVGADVGVSVCDCARSHDVSSAGRGMSVSVTFLLCATILVAAIIPSLLISRCSALGPTVQPLVVSAGGNKEIQLPQNDVTLSAFAIPKKQKGK